MNKKWNLFAVFGLITLFTIPFLFSGSLSDPSHYLLGNNHADNPAMFYFLEFFSGKSWREGLVPLWNPYIMLGLPFLAEGQAAVFHPLQLFFIFLSTPLAYNLGVFLCFLASGLFFFLYLRSLQISNKSAFLAAITWNFSSLFVSRIYAGHFTNILIFPTLPLLMFCCERWRRTPHPPWLFPLTSLTYAIMILSAHPQFLYIFSLFVFLHEFLFYFSDFFTPTTYLPKLRNLLLFLSAIILGIGLASVQLIPAIEFAWESFRAKSSFEYCSVFSFAPENILTLLCPRCFGSSLEPKLDYYWGRNYFWEMWLYFGLFPLLAAFIGSLTLSGKRKKIILCCLFSFFLVALGKHTPLFKLLYNYLPLFDLFRGASKFSVISLFCGCVLAAFGFEYLFETRKQQKKFVPIATNLLILAFVAVLCGIYLIWGTDAAFPRWQKLAKWVFEKNEVFLVPLVIRDSNFAKQAHLFFSTQLLKSLMLVGLSSIIVLVGMQTKKTKNTLILWSLSLFLILWDLGSYSWPLFQTFSEEITTYPQQLLANKNNDASPLRILDTTSFHNIGMKYSFSNLRGYSGNTLKRFNNFLNRSQGFPLNNSQAVTMINNYAKEFAYLALDLVVSTKEPKQEDLINPSIDTISAITPPLTSPRAFLAESAFPSSLPETALDYLFMPEVNPLRNVVVETLQPLPQAQPLTPEENVVISSFSINAVEIKVNAIAPRVLVLNEMYERGWQAEINGSKTSLFPANYLFRGIIVPKGYSEIRFFYSPLSFHLGLYTTFLSLGLLVGITLVLIVFKKGKGISIRFFRFTKR